MATLLRLACNTLAPWVAVRVVRGFEFNGPWPALVVMAIALATVNVFVRPLAFLFSVPLKLLPLGAFILGLNVLVLSVVLWASDRLDLGLTSMSLGTTLLAALLLAVVSWILSAVFGDDRQRA